MIMGSALKNTYKCLSNHILKTFGIHNCSIYGNKILKWNHIKRKLKTRQKKSERNNLNLPAGRNAWPLRFTGKIQGFYF